MNSYQSKGDSLANPKVASEPEALRALRLGGGAPVP